MKIQKSIKLISFLSALAIIFTSMFACGETVAETESTESSDAEAEGGTQGGAAIENPFAYPEAEVYDNGLTPTRPESLIELGVPAMHMYAYDTDWNSGAILYWDGNFYEEVGYGFINEDKEFVIPPLYKYVRPFASNGLANVENFAAYYSGQPWLYHHSSTCGFINESGEYVIEPQFDGAHNFTENGLARVLLRDGGYAYINENGEKVIEIEKPEDENACIDAYDFMPCGLAWIHTYAYDENYVDLYNCYGLINEKGEYVFEPQFSKKTEFTNNGLAIVRDAESRKYGIINKDGEFVTEMKYDELYSSFSSNGVTVFGDYEKEKYGLINYKGEIIVEPQFERVYDFDKNGIAGVEKDGEYYFINENGEKVDTTPEEEPYETIAPVYYGDSARSYYAETAVETSLDAPEEEPSEKPLYEIVGEPSANGYVRFQQDEKYGYLDKDGNVAIAAQFENAGDFTADGFAVAMISEDNWYKSNGHEEKKEYVLINEKGEILDRASYALSRPGAHIVMNPSGTGGRGYVNENGDLVLEPVYNFVIDGKVISAPECRFNEDGVSWVYHVYDRKYGLINENFELIVEPQFDDIQDFVDGKAEAKIDDEYYIVYADGTVKERDW